jgi:hypothetical protein
VATINDLRAWFCMHAVAAKRQLLEVLTQFLENHFVTQYQKTVDYMGTKGYDNANQQRFATDLEFREIMRWRQALLDPNCTFSNLLRISAESPAMIIYLDTVGSRGDGVRIANENYARELLELFTCGVDNGYDQNDITVMSRAWTGWSVELVDATNIYNPFALKSTTQIVPGLGNNYSNLVAFGRSIHPRLSLHERQQIDLSGKTVPARFGAPWAGRSYELNIPKTAQRATNGINDGYQIISHLCNQPFTEEYSASSCAGSSFTTISRIRATIRRIRTIRSTTTRREIFRRKPSSFTTACWRGRTLRPEEHPCRARDDFQFRSVPQSRRFDAKSEDAVRIGGEHHPCAAYYEAERRIHREHRWRLVRHAAQPNGNDAVVRSCRTEWLSRNRRRLGQLRHLGRAHSFHAIHAHRRCTNQQNR